MNPSRGENEKGTVFLRIYIIDDWKLLHTFYNTQTASQFLVT